MEFYGVSASGEAKARSARRRAMPKAADTAKWHMHRPHEEAAA
jgi:hypothetical protein